PGQGTLYVESGIAARESKFSMLLGTLLLLGGSKTIVRLTQFGTPIPAFGATVGAMPGAVQVVNGLLSMLVAVLVLRLDRRALSAGMAYVGIGLVSTVLSWSQFDPW